MQQQHDFERLDALLAKRHFEPAFPALAERIINAAKYSRGHVNVIDWLKGLFADFRLPQPAYAFALMLLLGVGIGFSDGNSSQDDTAGMTLEASISDEGNYL